MAAADRGLLSIGVFIVILVVSILLFTLGLMDWSLIPPFIIAAFGVWTIVLAGLRASNPQKYEQSAFTTFAWGILMVAVGGAWFMYGYGPLYSMAIILLVIGALAIAAALKRK